MSNEISEKKQGRIATAFTVFSALTLIVSAAFGPQIKVKLSIPAGVIYGLAIFAGVLTLLLNLGLNSDGFSKKLYLLSAHAYTISASLLTLTSITFTFIEYKGITNQAIVSALLFLFLCLAAIFFLYRLVSSMQKFTPSDSVDA